MWRIHNNFWTGECDFYLLFGATEVQELEIEATMPKTSKVNFDDPNKLHSFGLTITPDDGYWQGGKFKFRIDVPEDYNIVVCSVWCLVKS